MQTFKLKPVFVNSKFIHLLYPLLFFGFLIFIISNPFLEFLEPQFVALVAIAVIGWAVYDVYKIIQYKKYFVTVDEEVLNINDKNILKWGDITSAKFHKIGFGMQGIITFNNTKDIKIPSAIENLELLKNSIEKNLTDQCEIITS